MYSSEYERIQDECQYPSPKHSQDAVLDAILGGCKTTTPALAKKTGLLKSQVNAAKYALLRRGILEKRPVGSSVRWYLAHG